MDYEYDKVWFNVVNCNPIRADLYAALFLQKYDKLIKKTTAMEVKQLTGYRLLKAAKSSSAIVGGLDSLHPKEPPPH